MAADEKDKQAYVLGSFLLAFIIALVIYVFKPGGEDALRFFGDSFYVLFAGIATLCGVYAYRMSPASSPHKKFLLTLTIAVALDLLAGVIYLIYESGFGVIAPFPSVADAAWLLFYIVAIIAFVYTLRKTRHLIKKTTVAVALTIGLSALLILYAALQSILTDDTYAMLDKAVSIAYPLLGIAAVLLAFLTLSALYGSRMTASWIAFVAAFAVYGFADLIYAYLEWKELYVTGSLIDLLWFVAQLLFAYGFYAQAKELR